MAIYNMKKHGIRGLNIIKEMAPQVGVNTLNAYYTLYTNSIQSPHFHGNFAVAITKWPLGLYARRHDPAPANGLTGQMLFSLPHANPMEQSPNQLPQKLPILKYTRQREIEILSSVIYIHQSILPAKCYCFNVAKINAAIRS